MNFLEKLLDGVAVEWKNLGEVAKIYDGTHQTPKYTSSGVPFVSVQNIRNLYTTKKFISVDDFEKYKYKPQKDDLFMTRIGDIGTCAVVENDEPLAYYVTLTLIRVDKNSILSKFLKYVIESHIGKSELYKRTLVHAAPIKINLGEIGKIIIPIPPLEIQAEIVRILDTFTALTAELTAELTDRKKQYNYYRDRLLTFEKGEAEWKTLGEVAKTYDGTHQTPKYSSSGVPFVSVENIRNPYKTKKFISVDDFEKYKYKPQKDDLFMTRIGDIGTCAVVENDEPLAYYVTLTLIRVDKNSILPKFLKYVIESHIGKSELYKRTLVNAAPIKINLGEIGKIIIPVPLLAEQTRIVTILDKFDAIATSIREGLPREIALRQKQYEYYRDLLLTFPKSEEVEA